MTLAAHRPGRATPDGASDLLVRRHEDDHAQALADQAIDDVEETRQALSCPLTRVCAQELAGVLHDEQPPQAIVSLFLVGVFLEAVHHGDRDRMAQPLAADHHRERRLEEHRHQVVRVLTEERVRIDDVVDLAPVAPLPGERAQRKRLAGPRFAVPEDELPTARRLEVAHQGGEHVPAAEDGAGRGRPGKVADNREGHDQRGGASVEVHPEGDRNLVRGAWIRRREEVLEALDDRGHGGAVGAGGRDGDVRPPELHFEHDAVVLEQRAVPALRRRSRDRCPHALEGLHAGRPVARADLVQSFGRARSMKIALGNSPAS
jgi:hypothetical protein